MKNPALCLYRTTHTEGSKTRPWVLGGPHEQTEVVHHRRGMQVKRRCLNCGNLSGPLPMQAVWEWIDALGTPVIRYGYMDDYPACSYHGCDQPGADLHHFAPRNTFGADADNWPVMPLCSEHHRTWHHLMDGYRWHRKAVS